MKKTLNFFKSFTTLYYQIVILICLFTSCASLDSTVVPGVNCDEVKQCQYSIKGKFNKLILVETDKFVMFIPEDSDAWKSKIECCIRTKNDTILKNTICIPCTDFVEFANSQLLSCKIQH